MIVEAHDVSVSFDDREVLHRISVVVGAGDQCALTGRSGSGKTTLLLVLAGLLAPTAGRLELAVPRRDIVYVPQAPALIPELTVVQNASLGLRVRGFPPRDAEDAAREQLRSLGLDDADDSLPSGTLRRHAAIGSACRALATRVRGCCSPTSRRAPSIGPPAGSSSVSSRRMSFRRRQRLWWRHMTPTSAASSDDRSRSMSWSPHDRNDTSGHRFVGGQQKRSPRRSQSRSLSRSSRHLGRLWRRPDRNKRCVPARQCRSTGKCSWRQAPMKRRPSLRCARSWLRRPANRQYAKVSGLESTCLRHPHDRRCLCRRAPGRLRILRTKRNSAAHRFGHRNRPSAADRGQPRRDRQIDRASARLDARPQGRRRSHDLPNADSFFQIVGAPPGSAALAAPDNVLLVPSNVFASLTSGATVVHQLHVRLEHRSLPKDPGAAANDDHQTRESLCDGRCGIGTCRR